MREQIFENPRNFCVTVLHKEEMLKDIAMIKN